MNFNHYFTNEELETVLKAWAEQYPGLINLCIAGQSHENQPIWLLAMTNFSTGPDQEKPAIWLDGNIHATELAGTTTVLYILQHLLENYGKEEQVTRLLDTSTVYAVPRINPDGAAAALSTNPRFVRSGVRPYPWEELDEGLHVQDIDGDSRILQMRILDPNGDWKPWDENPRFMIKRKPADFGGTYYRLLPEGLIENYDGYIIDIARPSAGLDFNRNFPFEWRPESDQRGAGPYPASEPEINAVVGFIARHPNISIALTFHTFSRVLLRPYSTRPDDQMDPGDLYVFKMLGEIGTRLTGYRNVSTFHDFTAAPRDITTGAFDDWMYDQFGAFVFTVELWDLPTEAGVQDRKFTDWFSRHPLEEDIMIFKWSEEHVGPQGYVAWYPFDHPQLGKVELGGWNTLYTWRNPPHELMSQEADRHVPFMLNLASLLPHLALHTVKVLPVGENRWTIDLAVENHGYLPAYTSQQARKRRAARPVIAELNLPNRPSSDGCRIVLGKERMEIGYLEGRSNKDDMASVFGASPTDNRGHIQWLVEAPAGTQLDLVVCSERAGVIRKTIFLGEE
jgi:murein tripeptide amidase MpaA